MSISMYDISIPVLTRGLTNVSAILAMAEAHATAKKFDSVILAQQRLFPDMHPLARQVLIACNTAKAATGRLARIEVPKHEDNEKTFGELQERLAKTLDVLKLVTPTQMKDAENLAIEIQIPKGSYFETLFPIGVWKFTGLAYLTDFVLPNFFFHISMVYALLRKNGVVVGKADFLGKIQ
jgi:uncharacterized protein